MAALGIPILGDQYPGRHLAAHRAYRYDPLTSTRNERQHTLTYKRERKPRNKKIVARLTTIKNNGHHTKTEGPIVLYWPIFVLNFYLDFLFFLAGSK
jgi:hypothetical protein